MNDPNAVGIFIAPITTKIDMPAPLFELLCCLLDSDQVPRWLVV